MRRGAKRQAEAPADDPRATHTDVPEVVASPRGTKRNAEDPPDDPNLCGSDGAPEFEMTHDEPNDENAAMEEMDDAPASVRAAVLGKAGSLPMESNMMDSLSETQGPLEDGPQVLMMAARAPTEHEDAKEQGPMPKPASKESIWGRRSAGGAREPGQRTNDSNIDKK